jgi:hypothetical protein
VNAEFDIALVVAVAMEPAERVPTCGMDAKGVIAVRDVGEGERRVGQEHEQAFAGYDGRG